MIEWWSEPHLDKSAPLCSVSFGGNKNTSQSNTISSSNQGLQAADKTALSEFIQPQVQNAFGPYLQQQLQTPFQMPTLNPQTGMYDTQDNAVNRLIQDSTGTASSQLAQRGMLNANQSPLVAQRGLQSFLPQYLQQVGQNIQNQQVVPEQVNQQRFQDVTNAFQQLIALLGGQSSATTVGNQGGSGFNFGLFS